MLNESVEKAVYEFGVYVAERKPQLEQVHFKKKDFGVGGLPAFWWAGVD